MKYDAILIRDLEVQALIGTLPEERLKRQTLIFNLELTTDLEAAGVSDDLRDSVNYSLVEETVRRVATESEFFLLEKMARAVCDAVLVFDGVEAVRVTVDKPAAPRYARSIAVRMYREKNSGKPCHKEVKDHE